MSTEVMGVGRDFLKIDAGGSYFQLPIQEKKTQYYSRWKTVLNMLLLIWLIQL
jgi:hypothetical protein